MKKPFTFKLDPKKVAKAKALGADLPEAIRLLIDKITDEHSCPVCGQAIKKKTSGK